MNNIIFAFVHSIWNQGEYHFISSCKVNLDNNTVFEIEDKRKDSPKNLHTLNREYVELPGGQERDIVFDENLKGDETILYI